jgi:hypothetical protein
MLLVHDASRCLDDRGWRTRRDELCHGGGSSKSLLKNAIGDFAVVSGVSL